MHQVKQAAVWDSRNSHFCLLLAILAEICRILIKRMYGIAEREVAMKAVKAPSDRKASGKAPGRKPSWEEGSTFTMRLDKKLLNAFHEAAAAKGYTASELMREFMQRVVQSAEQDKAPAKRYDH